MGHDHHTITVFAPVMYLTVTIESSSSDVDEIHIHPGGQGFWIARMLRQLEERPLLCGPVGGEAGKVFRGLLEQFGMDVSTVEIAGSSPVVVTDRRSGDRKPIAVSPTVSLERHEIDDLYGRFLDRALDAGLCVVTGQSDAVVPTDLYTRLGHDLASADIRVVADLHGPELCAFLEGGPIDVLKVSQEDLVCDGALASDKPSGRSMMGAMQRLVDAGARSVVLSRQNLPTLARIESAWFEARTPCLSAADHRGAGDSMTAGLAAASRRELAPEAMLQLACAAGAANVTRHGLGTADAGLVPALAPKVSVREVGPGPR